MANITRRALLLAPLLPVAHVYANEIYSHDFENGKLEKDWFFVNHRNTSFFEEWSILDLKNQRGLDMKKRGIAYSMKYSSRTVNALFDDYVENGRVLGYSMFLELAAFPYYDITISGGEPEVIGELWAHKRFDPLDMCATKNCLDADLLKAIEDGNYQFYREARELLDQAHIPFTRF